MDKTVLQTAKAPPKKGALVLCSDAGWALQSAFALQRAIDSDPQNLLDYYFFCDFDLAASPYAHIFDPRVQVIYCENVCDNISFSVRSHIPKQCFLRFFALDILSEKYDRVCYLDGDIYLSWGSWAELFTLPVAPFAISAVAARPIWFDKPNHRYGRKYRAALNPDMGDRYFNSGVLLINSALFRSQNIVARALDFFAQYPDLCSQYDQSALNAVLAGQWAELSPSWNWQMSGNSYALLQDLHPRAIHFTGEVKPWNDSYALYTAALRPYAQYVASKGFDDMAKDLRELLAINPYGYPRRMQRIHDWVGEKEHKHNLMRTYLHRDDFVDTVAGLAAYGAQPSGFGHAPPP